MTAPTGTQWRITGHGYAAVIVETGGALRSLTHNGRAVLAGYPEDTMPGGGRGQTLLPWPNRIRDGRYTFAGTDHQLALSEPGRHNASHGLVRWSAWQRIDATSSSVTTGCRLMAQSGYPWTLDLTQHYALGPSGLTVTVSATNLADSPAPFAAGLHPYLAVAGPLDEALLTVPARTRLLVDDRLLPAGEAPVDGSEYDFTAPAPIGSLVLDTGFTDLLRGADRRAVVRLEGEGSAVELWVDEQWKWLQLFTGDALPDGPPGTGPRQSLAVEPMTSPPDAFNSGRDLVVLQPGASWRGEYGVRVG